MFENTQQKKKRNALHYTAANGNIEIASVLLKSLNYSDKSSLISPPDNNFVTSVYWSCSKGYLEFSKWLLEEFKNCQSESDHLLHTFKDKDGNTPIEAAVFYLQLEIVSWLDSIDPDCMKTRKKTNEGYYITQLQTTILKLLLFSENCRIRWTKAH